MLDADSIIALQRLLVLYEGVTVERLRCHPSGSGGALLRISSHASLARLAECAVKANVALAITAVSRGNTDEEWSRLDRLQFQLSARQDPEGMEGLTVQLFCAGMVQDLARRGLLNRAEADQLLSRWGFGAGDDPGAEADRPRG